MKHKLNVFLVFCIIMIAAFPLSAHTDIKSHAGLLSNIIAVVIVLLTIGLYLFFNNRKTKKNRKRNNDKNS
jgi:uncharacterized membrane protein